MKASTASACKSVEIRTSDCGNDMCEEAQREEVWDGRVAEGRGATKILRDSQASIHELVGGGGQKSRTLTTIGGIELRDGICHGFGGCDGHVCLALLDGWGLNVCGLWRLVFAFGGLRP